MWAKNVGGNGGGQNSISALPHRKWNVRCGNLSPTSQLPLHWSGFFDIYEEFALVPDLLSGSVQGFESHLTRTSGEGGLQVETTRKVNSAEWVPKLVGWLAGVAFFGMVTWSAALTTLGSATLRGWIWGSTFATAVSIAFGWVVFNWLRDMYTTTLSPGVILDTEKVIELCRSEKPFTFWNNHPWVASIHAGNSIVCFPFEKPLRNEVEYGGHPLIVELTTDYSNTAGLIARLRRYMGVTLFAVGAIVDVDNAWDSPIDSVADARDRLEAQLSSRLGQYAVRVRVVEPLFTS